jgi:tol-pal system protein YbgF
MTARLRPLLLAALLLAAAPAAAQQGNGLAAELLTRVGEQEAALRRLTAQVEALQFESAARERALEARIADLEFRVLELEGGDPFAANAAPEPTAPGTPAEPAAPAAPAAPPGTSTALAPPPRPLGTLRLSEAQGEEAAAFAEARRTLAAEGLEPGLAAFSTFAATYPSSPLNGDAAFLLGEAYVERGRFQDAARQFLAGFRDHPGSARSPDNMLGLGQSLLTLGRQPEGCGTLAELPRRFPDADPALLETARQEAAAAACP